MSLYVTDIPFEINLSESVREVDIERGGRCVRERAALTRTYQNRSVGDNCFNLGCQNCTCEGLTEEKD